ncbi:MAG: RagB/SusD family nutrient uptake outer membrane protein [Bacteroidales bacterium]|jgi:hypothetical protein|nr:RagB/SusD family nutrient uptake outer membrane protein [Bacteroidales bacterium]
MKKISFIHFLRIAICVSCIAPLSFSACTDVAPDEVVAYEDFYAGVDDADAAVLGLYGQFMGLAEQVVVLNELKADLMDVTENASTDLEEINLNIPTTDNRWANVSNFYSVIQTCNDMLHNYDRMFASNRLTDHEYNERYSDVAALRCWIYLQLSNLFGNVPYIVEPIIALEDLDKYRQNVLTPENLIPELIRVMENLPTLEDYRLSKLVTGTVDGYSLTPFFIQKKCLLGDLYLYNNEYEKAVRIYREILSKGENEAASNRDNSRPYRLYTDAWSGTGTVDWFSVLYLRDKNDDADSFYNAWANIFLSTTTDRASLEELLWFVAYDTKFAPQFTLSKLFDPVNRGGTYYLKPSDYAVDDIWGSETQRNGYPFDARGLTGAFNKFGDQNHIRKYSYLAEAVVGSSSGNCGNWFLYRAAMLHLRYAEAANRAGYPRLAWALVNDGIGGAAFRWTKPDGSSYRGDSVSFSSYGAGQPYPEPYYFDARYIDQPYIRAPWRYNGGVRGRANLPNIALPEEITTRQDSILFIEKMIIREAALELGFEGNRWGDLVRVARRLNREMPGAGTHFLWNENIAQKFARSGIAAPDLSTEEKWYLPLWE